MDSFQARWLAPGALAAALLAVLLIFVASSGDDGGDGAAVPASATQTTQRTSTGRRPRTSTRPRTTPTGTTTTSTTGTTGTEPDQETYVVRPGDTPSSISAQTGVPIDRLLELNPELDPQALTVGQEIRLKP